MFQFKNIADLLSGDKQILIAWIEVKTRGVKKCTSAKKVNGVAMGTTKDRPSGLECTKNERVQSCLYLVETFLTGHIGVLEF